MFENVERKSEYMAFFLSKAIDTIETNYYHDISYDDLYHGAIKGMVELLDDYSVYVNTETVEDNIKVNSSEISSEKLQKYCKLRNRTVEDFNIEDIYDLCDIDICKKIKFIKIWEIAKNTKTELDEIIRNLVSQDIEYIILDLRDNYGGYVDYAVEICNLLIESGELFTSHNKKGDCRIYNSNLSKKPFKEIVTLTNHGTASAAEAIARALQLDGNTVIGKKTYGKGIAQRMFKIYGGGGINLSVEEFFDSKGAPINRIGVIPDVLVERAEINGSDETLIQAIKYITSD